MKIGFDAKRAFYNNSGLGNYSRSTIDLLTKHFSSHNYLLYTTSIENSIHFERRENTKVFTPVRFFNKRFPSYWRTFKLSKQIKRDKLDIFHGLSNELPQNAHKTGAKIIVTVHDLIFLRFPGLYNKIDRTIYFQKFKYACNIADIIIAISEQTKSDIVNYFGISEDKITVVYQGCDKIFAQEISTSNKIQVAQKYHLPEKYILNVGTVEPRKNALNIVKAVHLNKIDLPVLIIGKPTQYQNKIEQYIAKFNLEDQIKIYNDIPFEEFPGIYQQAEMLVYPSIFEGFGIPIIEGLTSGIPVITTKGGCFSEAGGQSSLYVDSNSIDELAAAIKKVAEDSEHKEKMISEGLEYVKRFSDDKVASAVMAVYQS